MKTIYSDTHEAHAYAGEFERGLIAPAREVPERARLVLDAVRARGLGAIVAPSHFGNEPILRVHAAEFVYVLEHAWTRWTAKYGFDNKEAIPSVWPGRGMRAVHTEDIEAALGYYGFDTATPIVAGTWTAARAAADTALTAAQLLLRGERAAFALTRPPGHHAASDLYGGYCFLNNAAIAAQSLIDRGHRVALLDVDIHHGNGTQAIFYDRADVLTISIHGDPERFYPHFLGYADESGAGAGEGFNANYPLPLGTGWGTYAQALEAALQRLLAFAPDFLIVPLGVDTHTGDPAGGFRLEGSDYQRLGGALGKLGLPTLFTLEGGYRLDTLGAAVADTLAAFEAA